MISKGLISLVRSLEHKKHRLREGLFVAEGPKVVGDLLQRFTPACIIATAEARDVARGIGDDCRFIEVTADELRRLSFLQHPQQVMSLFRLPPAAPAASHSDLTLALDGVQDPGNVGTIIRTADWFGIDTIVCSPDTADAYAPKVVQATMGSLARVSVVYTDLPSYLRRSRAAGDATRVYGTFLRGDDIFRCDLSGGGIIVVGNEGKGISADVEQTVTHRLTIPGHGAAHGDSLNVAIATAIVCAAFRRGDV